MKIIATTGEHEIFRATRTLIISNNKSLSDDELQEIFEDAIKAMIFNEDNERRLVTVEIGDYIVDGQIIEDGPVKV